MEFHRAIPVLGPLLWDLAYDEILRGKRPPGCTLVCYADDTLQLAAGENWTKAREKVEECAVEVLRDSQNLGLTANAEKTEVFWLEVGARERPPRGEKEVTVSDVCVAIAWHAKYLGVVLDERGTYSHHFRLLVPKLERTAASLGRILPKGELEGAGRRTQKALREYSAVNGPIWGPGMGGTREWKPSNKTMSGLRTEEIKHKMHPGIPDDIDGGGGCAGGLPAPGPNGHRT